MVERPRVVTLAKSPVRAQQTASNSHSLEWAILYIMPSRSFRWLQSQQRLTATTWDSSSRNCWHESVLHSWLAKKFWTKKNGYFNMESFEVLCHVAFVTRRLFFLKIFKAIYKGRKTIGWHILKSIFIMLCFSFLDLMFM